MAESSPHPTILVGRLLGERTPCQLVQRAILICWCPSISCRHLWPNNGVQFLTGHESAPEMLHASRWCPSQHEMYLFSLRHIWHTNIAHQKRLWPNLLQTLFKFPDEETLQLNETGIFNTSAQVTAATRLVNLAKAAATSCDVFEFWTGRGSNAIQATRFCVSGL